MPDSPEVKTADPTLLGKREVPTDPKEVVLINLTDFKSVLLENIKLFCNVNCKSQTCKDCNLEKFRLMLSRMNVIDLYKTAFPAYLSISLNGSAPMPDFIKSAVEMTEDLGAITVFPKQSIMSLIKKDSQTLLDE